MSHILLKTHINCFQAIQEWIYPGFRNIISNNLIPPFHLNLSVRLISMELRELNDNKVILLVNNNNNTSEYNIVVVTARLYTTITQSIQQSTTQIPWLV